MRALVASTFALAFAGSAMGCSKPDLKEWTPADHDRVEENQRIAQGGQPGSQKDMGAAMVELAWKNQCTACHGATGRGDGPQASMVQPPDMTNPEWQSKVTDAEMATSIRNGKNRMPKFDLPDEVVAGLVTRIRGFAPKK